MSLVNPHIAIPVLRYISYLTVYVQSFDGPGRRPLAMARAYGCERDAGTRWSTSPVCTRSGDASARDVMPIFRMDVSSSSCMTARGLN